MSWIDTFFDLLKAEFKPIVILVSCVFAIHLSLKRIGHSVSAQYSIGARSFEPEHIQEVVLLNKKDRPVNIYALHAVFNDDLWLELERYSPPKTLKPHESLALTTRPHTYLYVGHDEFIPDYSSANIYLESDESVIRCHSKKRPNLLAKYRKVTVIRHSYNGFIYDNTVSFILAYVINGSLKTAFIGQSGYIGNEWDLTPNHLGEPPTESNIKSMIHRYGFNSLFSYYILYRVESSGRLNAVKE